MDYFETWVLFKFYDCPDMLVGLKKLVILYKPIEYKTVGFLEIETFKLRTIGRDFISFGMNT